MSQSEIGRRYAKALFTSMKQNGQQARALEEIRTVVKILEGDPVVKTYMTNPLVSSLQKVEVIRKAFADKGLSSEVFDFILLMAEKNRINFVSDVATAYESIIDQEMGVTRGTVRAAKPLTPEYQKDLEAKMNQILNKRIVLTYKEDPSLLGGVIAEVGGWTFDDSIDMHLKKLNEVLMK